MKLKNTMITAGLFGICLTGLVGCELNPSQSSPPSKTQTTSNNTSNSISNNPSNNTTNSSTSSQSNSTSTSSSNSTNKTNATTNNQTTTGTQTDVQSTAPMTQRAMYIVNSNGSAYQIYPGKVNYNPQSQPIHVVMTNAGVVWNPVPEMSSPITNQTNLNNHPVQPYSIYLNTNNDSILTTTNSNKIFTLPLKSNENTYYYIDGFYNAGNYLVYNVSLRIVGAPQASSNDLYALNLSNHENTLITSYQDGGGNSFSIAISGGSIYYKQLLVSGPESLNQYSLTSGKSEQLTWAPSGLTWISL